MVCDVCKEKEATVHLTEIIDGKVIKFNLCEECAKKKGSEMEEHFGLSDLLAGLASLEIDFEEEKQEEEVACPNCGLTYNMFKKIGRLGCSKCYTTFSNKLKPLLKKIHGSTGHIGKAPFVLAKERNTELEIQTLRKKLQQAIDLEKFEEAAKIRDKIKMLDSTKNKNSKKNETKNNA